MKKLWMLSVALITVFSTVARAEQAAPPEVHTGFTFHGTLGINLIQATNYPNSLNRMTPLFGVGAEYYFTPVVGVFMDAQYTNRGIRGTLLSTGTTESASTHFIDVPFGLAFNHGSKFLGTGRSATRLGGYVALPLRKSLQGDANMQAGLTNVEATPYFGINVDNITLFPVGSGLELGYAVWVKIPVGGAIKVNGTTLDYSSSEIGLGLAIGF